jgi:hypothetical protein
MSSTTSGGAPYFEARTLLDAIDTDSLPGQAASAIPIVLLIDIVSHPSSPSSAQKLGPQGVSVTSCLTENGPFCIESLPYPKKLGYPTLAPE